MIAFICATPLQVFNAINIMFHHFPNEKMDIYALNFRINMRKVLLNYKSSNSINDVIYIDMKLHSKNVLKIMTDYIFPDRRFCDLFSQNRYYTDLFTTWVGGYGTLIYNMLLKTNKKIKLHFYEEGIGVYVKNIFDYYGKIRLFFKMAGIKCEADYVEDVYLYRPELIFPGNKYASIKIGSYIKEDNTYMKELENIFGISNIVDNNNIIYLENYFEPSIFGEYDQISLIKKIKKNNFEVRLHPITDKKKYIENKILCTDNSVPWEFYLAENANVNNMTFISIYSSAIFSSKLIFDEEPTIIILGKAVSNALKKTNKNWMCFYPRHFERLVKAIRQMYSDKSKVIVPDTLNEFYSIINDKERL